jgi:cation:H+ antiporter
MLLYVLVFLASAAVVVAAGTVLTRTADAIAQATGLGRAWIGAALLAGATSLPEIATDVSAVRMHAPNLAAGDLFGSSLANMLILAIIDQLSRERGVLRSAAIENALTACLAISLNTLGALFVLARPRFTLLGVSPLSLVLLLVYLGGTRLVYRNGVRHSEALVATPAQPANATSGSRRSSSLKRTLTALAAAAVVILVASPALAWSAKHLAEATGLGSTFIGTWLLGLCTSLPELATSIAAVRIGALDLAVGTLFGSNSFNMVIFVALDIAYPAGSIFGGLSATHAISGMLAVVLMTLGLAGILYRAERRFIMLEPDSALMILVYAFSIWIIYAHSVAG